MAPVAAEGEVRYPAILQDQTRSCGSIAVGANVAEPAVLCVRGANGQEHSISTIVVCLEPRDVQPGRVPEEYSVADIARGLDVVKEIVVGAALEKNPHTVGETAAVRRVVGLNPPQDREFDTGPPHPPSEPGGVDGAPTHPGVDSFRWPGLAVERLEGLAKGPEYSMIYTIVTERPRSVASHAAQIS